MPTSRSRSARTRPRPASRSRTARAPTRREVGAVEAAVEDIRQGRMVIVVDDARENEGDLVMAASKITPAAVNFIVTEARGLLCVALSPERAETLDLFPMIPESNALHGTAFTVSVDAVENTTSGTSAHDRAA